MSDMGKLLIEGSGKKCEAESQSYLDSYIKVHEKIITGRTICGLDFNFTYEKISSVDMRNSNIIICNFGNEYNVLVENPAQIQHIIHQQITAAK